MSSQSLNLMHQLANVLETITLRIGQCVRWLALAMVLVMSANVAMRYLFASGEPWQQELVRFMHAALFLLGAGYALKEDSHVRVDVFYQRFSPKAQALVTLVGTIGLLFPCCIALIGFSADYIMDAWRIKEGSAEYHGMPGVYLLKSCIWLCAGLLMVQGCAASIRAVCVLREGNT